ncbi:hypothetical protein EON63_02235 [archaeon]|nr:MAG: hypothetical protein EON63_02235 [archaeon]
MNYLFGDIVKVTPSSKCVGDLAIFLVMKGLTCGDLIDPKTGMWWLVYGLCTLCVCVWFMVSCTTIHHTSYTILHTHRQLHHFAIMLKQFQPIKLHILYSPYTIHHTSFNASSMICLVVLVVKQGFASFLGPFMFL